MWIRTHTSGRPGVTVRANYVALPSMAGRGQDEGGRKPAGSEARYALILSRKHGPPDTNRREWSAVRRRASFSQRKRNKTFAPCGAPCPSLLRGETESKTRARRGNNGAWLYDNRIWNSGMARGRHGERWRPAMTNCEWGGLDPALLPLTSPRANDVLPAMNTASCPARLWWRTF